jgi:hypothetical protein
MRKNDFNRIFIEYRGDGSCFSGVSRENDGICSWMNSEVEGCLRKAFTELWGKLLFEESSKLW